VVAFARPDLTQESTGEPAPDSTWQLPFRLAPSHIPPRKIRAPPARLALEADAAGIRKPSTGTRNYER